MILISDTEFFNIMSPLELAIKIDNIKIRNILENVSQNDEKKEEEEEAFFQTAVGYMHDFHDGNDNDDYE